MVWVWYTIVEKSSQNAGGVYLRDDAPIVELMRAVAAENTYALARNCADPQDLVVYLSKSDLESQNPVISKSDTISKISSGRQADEMFYILIRDRTADTLSATTVKLTGFDFLRKLVFYTEKRCCVTALNQHNLVTFAHGHHSSLKIGENINIFSLSGDKFCVTVKNVEKDKDFVILESSEDICEYRCSVDLPYQGGEYIQVGLSATTQVECQFSLSKGIFTSVCVNTNGQILGSGGSNPGESGGGCFSIHHAIGIPVFLGMNVGCEMVPISGSTTLYELGTRYPARALIVPAILFQ